MRRILTRTWYPWVILAIGVIIAVVVAKTGPEAPKRSIERQARLVEVSPLEYGDIQVVVEAMGTVQPARQVEMRAQVTGQVVETSPSLLPGGILDSGDALLRIDPRDYELAVKQRQSDVARAEQGLKLEQGQQDYARREYDLLGEVVSEEDAELVLRRPQLQTAESAYRAAQAGHQQARLDLERTRVTAPFNSVVLDKHVDLGGVVNTNTTLATLVGTDAFWIELKVPVEKLKWVQVPSPDDPSGSVVQIRQTAIWGEDVCREGRVLRLQGNLEPEGRMAQLLVKVEDPLCLQPENRDKPVLLMDSFVEARILGRLLVRVVSVPRKYVRERSTVWLMDDDDRLEIRSVEPLYSGKDRVFVAKGLRAGERIVTSEFSAPVAGMPLRLRGDSAAARVAGAGTEGSR